MNTRTVPLARGLDLVLQDRPGTGAVAVSVVLAVGSDDDPVDLPGAAHLAEHLLTPRTDTTDGVLVAARTGHQSTEFTLLGPARSLPALVRLARSLLDGSSWTDPQAERLESETAVIALESLQVRTGAWTHPPWSAVPATLFGADPGTHDGFGRPELLAAAAPARIRDLLDTHHRRVPAAVAVVGDLGDDGTRLPGLFAGLPDRDRAAGTRLRPRAATGTFPADRPGPVLAGLCLPIADPATDPQEYAAALVLAQVVPGTGRLRSSCGYGRPFDRAGSDIFCLLSGLPGPTAPDVAVDDLTGVLDRAAATGPAALDTARRLTALDLHLRAGAPGEAAADLARCTVLFGDTAPLRQITDEVRAVDGDRLDGLWRRWRSGPLAVTVLGRVTA